MALADTVYSAEFRGPELLEQRRANLIKCAVKRDGALVAPDSGTVSVFNANNVAVIDEQSVTITDDIAEYNISQLTLSSQTLGENWRIEWTLTMPDGVSHFFENDAALVKKRLYPCISQDDLVRRHTDLLSQKNSNESSLQNYIDDAFFDIEGRLIAKGRRPWLIMSPSALRECLISKTMAMISMDFATSQGLNSKWNQMIEIYEARFEKAWNELSFAYDEDGDGQAEAGRKSANPVVWLMAPREASWR